MIDLNNQDCLEAMRQMTDSQFDLAIVDPPYGIGFDGQKESKSTNRLKHDFKGWDSQIPSEEYFVQLKRISKNQIVWGGNYMTEYLSPSRCWLIWDKMQKFTGADFEMAWTSFESSAKAFRMSRVEAYTTDVKIHPTQKPVRLYEWILDKYAKEGQTILDTHLGSGSIALACHNRGYSLTAFEIDKEYFEAAKKRLEIHQAQLTMF